HQRVYILYYLGLVNSRPHILIFNYNEFLTFNLNLGNAFVINPPASNSTSLSSVAPVTQLALAITPTIEAMTASPASYLLQPDSLINCLPKLLIYSFVFSKTSSIEIGTLTSPFLRATIDIAIFTAWDVMALGRALLSILNGCTLLILNEDCL